MYKYCRNLHKYERYESRTVSIGDIPLGGDNPIRVQSMTTTNTMDTISTVEQSIRMIDAGCEYEHYASDVTRTFPVGKKFSDEQKKIYEIVLEAHKQASAEIKPGNPWNKAHDTAIKVITEGLINLGILKGNPDDLIESGEYSKFYMHRIGHWLGMDVHDVGNYKKNGKWRDLEAGMVLTVEPGIYILDTLEDVEEKWLGIGIRIEDDLLVTNLLPLY